MSPKPTAFFFAVLILLACPSAWGRQLSDVKSFIEVFEAIASADDNLALEMLVKENPALAQEALGVFHEKAQAGGDQAAKWAGFETKLGGLLQMGALPEKGKRTCQEMVRDSNTLLESQEYARALEKLNDATGCYRRLDFKDDSYEMGEVINNISNIYMLQGRNTDALDGFLKVLGIFTKKFGDQSPEAALIHNNLGAIYINIPDYRQALAHLSTALAIRIKTLGIGSDATLITINNIGAVHRYMGDYAEALRYYHTALDQMLKLSGMNNKSAATAMINLGDVYSMAGDYDSAASYLLQAMDILKNLNLERSAEFVKAMSNLGTVYSLAGDGEKASEFISQSMSLEESLLGKDNPLSWLLLNNMGLAEIGADNNKALDYLEKAAAALDGMGGGNNSNKAIVFSNIALACSNMRDWKCAADNARKAIELETSLPDPGRPALIRLFANAGAYSFQNSDIEEAKEFLQKAIEAACGEPSEANGSECLPLADSVFALWKMAEALGAEGSLADSSAYYEKAADILESLRGNIQGKGSQVFYSGIFNDMFAEGAGNLKKLAEQTGDSAYAERAFQYAERGIAQVFLRMLSRHMTELNAGLPASVAAERENLKVKLNMALESYESATSSGENGDVKDAYKDLESAAAALKQFDEKTASMFPEFDELTRPRAKSLAEIRASVLAPEETALEYILGEKASYLILISRDSLKIKDLPPAPEIERLISLFRKKLTDSYSDQNAIKRTAGSLYDMLIAPAAADLSGVKRLLIVPAGDLYFLPFETLFSKGGYLAQSFEIRYAPSLSALCLARMRKDTRIDTFENDWRGFGDPVYSEDDERNEGARLDEPTRQAMNSYARALAENGKERGGVWPRIEGTGIEAFSIHELFLQKGAREKLSLGLNASEASFKAAARGGARYLHVASHGTLGEGGANQPALVLSLVGNEQSGEDGFVTMTEVFDMKIPSEMVVLSACNTGQGKMERGEGVAGMARAFLFSGADSLVVSLWSVADEQTKDLMVDFYGKLLGGANRESALREAKLSMINQGMHPFFWAPFIYIGLH